MNATYYNEVSRVVYQVSGRFNEKKYISLAYKNNIFILYAKNKYDLCIVSEGRYRKNII